MAKQKRALPRVARKPAPKSKGRGTRKTESSKANDAMPPLAGTVARLHRAILDELAVVETLHANLDGRPQDATGAARTARTLSSLTATLQKLQSLQRTPANPGPDHDDMPADIDEFRNELARRIDTFVASRTDQRNHDASVTPPLAAPAR